VPCLGRRPIIKGVAQPYEYQTFAEVTARVAKIATGLKALGLRARDKVAVLSVNCPDWMIAMQVRSAVAFAARRDRGAARMRTHVHACGTPACGPPACSRLRGHAPRP
jgi:long-subunit acyl-CoA synthetase (AMP-forming)